MASKRKREWKPSKAAIAAAETLLAHPEWEALVTLANRNALRIAEIEFKLGALAILLGTPHKSDSKPVPEGSK